MSNDIKNPDSDSNDDTSNSNIMTPEFIAELIAKTVDAKLSEFSKRQSRAAKKVQPPKEVEEPEELPTDSTDPLLNSPVFKQLARKLEKTQRQLAEITQKEQLAREESRRVKTQSQIVEALGNKVKPHIAKLLQKELASAVAFDETGDVVMTVGGKEFYSIGEGVAAYLASEGKDYLSAPIPNQPKQVQIRQTAPTSPAQDADPIALLSAELARNPLFD